MHSRTPPRVSLVLSPKVGQGLCVTQLIDESDAPMWKLTGRPFYSHSSHSGFHSGLSSEGKP